MTPKEKAIELIDKYWELDVDDKAPVWTEKCKQCALISVDEILYTLNEISEEDNNTYAYHTAVFYNEVKTELKNI